MKTSNYFLAAFALFVVGCSSGDEGAKPGRVRLMFHHTVAGEPLVFNAMDYANAVGETYSVETLEYYVSDIVFHLVPPAGTAPVAEADVPLLDVHYVDAGDPATLELPGLELPPGTYDGVTFVFGLNEDRNVPGGLSPTPENINMIWPEPLGGGYHYMKLEGKYSRPDSAAVFGYTTHLGRTMTTPHFFFVSASFAPLPVDGGTIALDITMDLAEWYEDPNLYRFPETPMIMGNNVLQGLLQENGATVFGVDVRSLAGFAPRP